MLQQLCQFLSIALAFAVSTFTAHTSSALQQQADREQKPVVRIFVLAGQSNMQGHGVVDMDHPEHYNGGKGNLVNTLKNSDQFDHLHDGENWTIRDDVFVRYQTEHETKMGGLSVGFSGYQGKKHFGPELQFGHVMGEFFEEPVLLIKTAWGGKSLFKDFRPPSAVKDRGGEVGEYYTKMLQEVEEGIRNIPTEFPALKDHQVKFSGFVWQQGWNDMIDENARGEYFSNLTCLINDVREVWKSPNLPVVLGELGNGGVAKKGNQPMRHFRNQQSRIDAHPPFVGNVLFAPNAQHARPAEESPNTTHLHHWYGNAESYLFVGDELGKQMHRLYTQPVSPRILILGDSISIGYTPIVKQAFQDKAFVVRPMANHRAAENCAGTDKGIENIDRWLRIGGGNWDVIHFNFGLHDLKHVDPKTGKNSNDPNHPEQSPPEDYRRQLTEIVDKLKATEAELIFGTTTPVPEGGVRPFRDPKSPKVYNQIAREVMKEQGVEINDLYGHANARLNEIQQPVNVHFNRDGSKMLGEKVVEAIEAAIKRKKLSKR